MPRFRRRRQQEENGSGYKRETWYLCGDGNILYLAFINVVSLVMILYHSFARCYHKGKLGIFLYCFLQRHVRLQFSQNKKCNRKIQAPLLLHTACASLYFITLSADIAQNTGGKQGRQKTLCHRICNPTQEHVRCAVFFGNKLL